ncbi:polyketide synthase PksD [Cucurbitaria berberidis CBS 394.84]|uniref:Polyketide synthase PksD n=1 Tax=Cucurbitaria berberidis CBS 394.84 TaxID=1168544 RepID=A0A9P4LEK9_9PLEO|nr:polyketide synthase PksD [Cucurbitaria berberidis CBS 394.84]KAF1852053.1 polyketide synthase PksD [Cucurbitaria berberidis CBS 394.84]
MEPIAIVGLAFRLPQGVEDESSFWDVLEQSKSVMTAWPESRVNIDAFIRPHDATPNTLPSRGAHFLSQDITVFDAPFFSISSREAASMDPQQRILLETSYHALENAGIPVEDIAGTDTGVFSGSMESDYHRTISKDPDEAPTNTATGASVSILANRLSWYFDLKGPSMQLNTACSSSMIAVDLACQSLRSGQSSMALATGSNLMLSPELSLYLSNMNMLSPDGICYSFDDRANGYSRGEGVIVLVLKTLHTAIRDGDNIRAVIRGTGSNQDGRTPGITQPSSTSQESLIRQVYRNCNLGFESTRYVEAHGTGTQIGDSTEMKALGAVFRRVRSIKAPLYVGSVKSNVGHLEGGSGLAGILKCILILEKGVIPPNALFEKLNAKINAKRSNIQVPSSCISWPDGGLRRVSVNSFGFGGSNAHAIMDDAYHTLEALSLHTGLHAFGSSVITCPVATNGHVNGRLTKAHDIEIDGPLRDEAPKVSDLNRTATPENDISSSPSTNGVTSSDSSTELCKYQLLVYSARDEAALKRVLQQYSRYHDDSILGSPSRLQKLAYTLATRRSMMIMRSFTVGDANLTSEAIGLPKSACVRSSIETQLCFVFTGQGAQYAKMGLELIQYPVFKSALIDANKVFQALGAGWSLFDKIESGEGINLPQFSQPLCTALQIALFELLKSFNVAPVAVVGHSSGEIAAAYALGALSLESACKVAYHRGRLSGQLAKQLDASTNSGAMMSVNLQEGGFRAYVDKVLPGADVHVACVNSPSNITLAGLEIDIDVLKGHLDDDGVFSQKIKTGIAYHTSVMRQIASEYLFCLNDLQDPELDSNTTLMVSSVTGQKITATELSVGQYWVDNLTSPVRFVDAVQYLTQAAPKLDGIKAISDYIEIGPYGALRRPILDTLSQIPNKKESKYASILSKLRSPLKTTMELAGHLFTRGHPISITAVNQQVASMGASSILADTPQYPFDRSQQYWYESRLSRDWRLRGAAPRSVLGIRATDWNPLEPRWRKMLSIEETPWIADHVVDGTIIFPAAGSIVMALEAVKQTVQVQQKISGYLVKEATFTSPIFVQPEKKTEVITQLRAIQHAYDRTSLRFEVVIFSSAIDGNWTECFKTVIHVQVKEDTTTEVDGGFEARAAQEAFSKSYEHATLSCKEPVTKQHYYEWLNKQGLSYGDAFALAEDIFWDGHELCIARVDNSPESYEGVVHPTVLDNCLQVCSTAPSGGMAKTMSTFIPHQMHDTWVSATGWQHPQTGSVRIKTQSRLNISSTGIDCSITALADDGSLLCHAKHVGMSAVANKVSMGDDPKRLLHSIDWKPQLSLLTTQQLSDYCGVSKFTEDETWAIDYCISLDDALRARLERDLTQLQDAIRPETPEHLKRFVAWIERQLCEKPGQSTNELSDECLDLKVKNLRAVRPSWRIVIDVLQDLTSTIRGKTDALDLLFSTPLAQDLYDEFFKRTCNDKLFSYLELATHQNPDQRVLEVGAGTGGMTNQVLAMLRRIEQRIGGTAFSEYVYTDISPAYFEGARERFADYRTRMSFKTLDLEHDITASIEPGSCDIILAGSVLHATKNLSVTLRNLRRALKPGGQLIFLEVTAPECFAMSFAFGILPGWWCGEEETRAWGPTITESEWDVLLRENGFSGNDLVIRDYEDERAHDVSIIVSSADDPPHIVAEISRILVVIDDQDEDQKSLASDLMRGVFDSSAYRPTIFSLSQIADAEVCLTDKILFLADMRGSILAEPSDDTFELIQNWVQQSKELLWVTAASVSLQSFPYTGLKDGLLRVIRSENSGKRIVSLSLEDGTSDMPSYLQHIAQVFHLAFEAVSPDFEYIVRDGKVLIGRLVLEVDLNKDLDSSIHPQTKHEAWLPGPPVKLQVGTRGSLDTLRFIEDEYRASLGPTEIEIENQAWAIGFRDVFSALGRLDENEFGTDCAGIVKRVGSQCNQLRPGDRVCTSSFGCMRTYVHCDELDAFKIPETLSVEEACGVINPVMTAWYSLVDVARLKKGEKILIHAASGATGQVAIQVAQMIGAEVFATVGYDHKKQLLIDDYGIPASNIFYSRDLSFVQGVMRMTDGYGVDVVLNSLVGEGLRASWECVAPYGRFIEIGKADIHANTPLPMASFANNRSFSAVDLRHLDFHRKDLARSVFFTTMGLVRDGTMHCPRPWHTYSVSDIEHAFRYLQSGKSTGRVVIQVEHSAKVQKQLIHRRTWRFDDNATYLIAAGLGGVGRSILRWMASKGAKQMIVPSRSGAASEAAIQVVNELTKLGVQIVTPKCDLAAAGSVQKVLEDYAHVMSPIRGCINATMVLQDSVFDNMTRAQWDATIRSKVQSSWNLHSLLPKDLDFFILLSSASGVIGNAGQSNYAAGCTFQDALSRFRVCHGQKAVSIDLGPMRSVGVVAEHEGLKRSFEKYQGLAPIEEEEFLTLMDIRCDPGYHSRTSTSESQVTMGIVTPVDLVHDGSDLPLEHMHRSLFAYFNQAGAGSSSSGPANSVNSAALFRQAESIEEMNDIVVESLVRKLARALSIQAEDVDVDKSLLLYGVDSLVAVELRNWITKEFAADVPVFELMSGKSVLAIAQLVTKTSQVKRVAVKAAA